MTYSLLARDPASGDLGVAVQSHFFGVGRVVPWGLAGVGVVATQSFVEVSYGPRGLELMAEGAGPATALERLLADDADSSVRQVAMMDATGEAAVFTGEGCIADAAHAIADQVCAQSNLCASPAIPDAMLSAYAGAAGSLPERMLAALRAAEDEGGDIRGRQSAAMLVVAGRASGDLARERLVDLRVDDAPDPLAELGRLLVVGDAMGGLLRILGTDGLVRGDGSAPADVVDRADAELREAQEILGPGNVEPTVWRGFILARAARPDEAREAFALASRGSDRVEGFVRRLAAAGMWSGDPSALDALLPPGGAQ